ncbi:PAS domain-containing sensor histidine kinase [Xanthocytophaga flava]|uniref:PAS domain-containing sensor histidine kinase n=1 Tax=Xanthocytophaga flava TaxID=3048013 RepID=UPI0028D0286A|nr:PAS domain S-box protein [Xanthocytophaga flavus]MDJ1468138.1 PAS domain S-box protein [Xanthocytophaga flavus]
MSELTVAHAYEDETEQLLSQLRMILDQLQPNLQKINQMNDTKKQLKEQLSLAIQNLSAFRQVASELKSGGRRTKSIPKGTSAQEQEFNLFRLVSDVVPDGMFIVESGIIQYANQAVAKLLGVENPSLLLGMLVTDVIVAPEEDMILLQMQKATAGEPAQPLIGKFLRQDESRLDVELFISKVSVGALPTLLITARDLTDKIQAQDARERLEYLLKETSSVIYAASHMPPYHVTYMSENVWFMTGYSAQQFINDTEFWMSRIHPEDKNIVLSGLTHIFEVGFLSIECRFLFADDQYHWVYNQFRLTYDTDRNVNGLVGCLLDITDKKKAEQEAALLLEETQRFNEELQASEEELMQTLDKTVELNNELAASEEFNRLIIDNANEGIIVFDNDCKYLVWNKYLERRTGRLAKDIIGQSPIELFPEIYGEDAPFGEILKRALTGETIIYPDTKITLEGRELWVSGSFSPFRNRDGEMTGVIVIVNGRTEQKQAELEINRQKNLLQAFFDAAQFFICIYEVQEDDYSLLLPNNYLAKRFGLTVEELSGKKASELPIAEAVRENWLNLLKRCLKEGVIEQVEFVQNYADQGPRWFFCNFNKIEGTNNVCAILIDITERMQIEEEKNKVLLDMQLLNTELQRSEAKLQEAQKIARLGMWEYDLGLDYAEWSDELFHIFGITKEQGSLSRAALIEATDPEYRDLLILSSQNAVEKQQEYRIELKIWRPDGDFRWLFMMGQPIVDETGVVIRLRGVCYDITQLKVAEEEKSRLLQETQQLNKELQASQSKLRKAQRIARLGIWEVDVATRTLEWSEELFHIFGIEDTSEAPTLSTFYEMVDPEFRASLKALGEAAIFFGESYEIEMRILPRDIAFRWVIGIGQPVYDDSGKVVRVVGACYDITEQKLAQNKIRELLILSNEINDRLLTSEEELRQSLENTLELNERIMESEQRWQFALEGSGEGLWDRNMLTNQVYFSARAKEILGFHTDEIVDRSEQWLDKVHPDDRESVLQAQLQHINGEVEVYHAEYRAMGRNDEYLWFQSRGKVIEKDALGRPLRMIGVIQDITERKKIEEQLRQQNEDLKKINAELDSFVYRASHDLRSPLTSVLGLIDICRSEDEEKERVHYLNLMEKSIARLDTFIQDIINYSRNSRIEVVQDPIDFGQLIQETMDGLKFIDGFDNIEKKVTINQHIPFYSDEFRLKIIFNNLISNAVKYRSSANRTPQIHIQITVNAQMAIMVFKDNGMGISKENLGKIFDMFYRASMTSKGSGLGLYIVRDVIERLKGHISVESELDKWTEFVIRVPNILPQENTDE